ncbi:MAG: hypothetical protein PHG47_08565 [Sulfuricella sp.]|nr:hypothetical protein [Sulfuricella sp.]
MSPDILSLFWITGAIMTGAGRIGATTFRLLLGERLYGLYFGLTSFTVGVGSISTSAALQVAPTSKKMPENIATKIVFIVPPF